MATKKKKKIKGKNVRIPIEEFETIQSFTDANSIIMGKFVATAAIEKIEREKK